MTYPGYKHVIQYLKETQEERSVDAVYSTQRFTAEAGEADPSIKKKVYFKDLKFNEVSASTMRGHQDEKYPYLNSDMQILYISVFDLWYLIFTVLFLVFVSVIFYTRPHKLLALIYTSRTNNGFLLYSFVFLVESSSFPAQAYNCIVTRVFNLIIITLDGEFY